MTDHENNLVGCVNPGSTSKLCPNLPSIDWRFVTAIAKGEPHHWASLGGNAQSGPLATMFDGPRVDSSCDPKRKQGGGDNRNGSQGTFYEAAMTTGYPSDATDQLAQANVAAAKYDVQQVSVAPVPAPPEPDAPTVGRVAGRFGSALQLDTSSVQAVKLPNGIVSELHDFTIAAWVYLGATSTWSRLNSCSCSWQRLPGSSPASRDTQPTRVRNAGVPRGPCEPRIASMAGPWHRLPRASKSRRRDRRRCCCKRGSAACRGAHRCRRVVATWTPGWRRAWTVSRISALSMRCR